MPEYPPFDERTGASQQLIDVLRTTLLAAGASMSECRQAVPYQPMHLVRKADGTLVWCCTHEPPHPDECAP